MMSAVLSNPNHPEYGVATIPFPIPHDQYTYCMELLKALEIGDAVKADCKVVAVDSFFSVLKRTEMLTVNCSLVKGSDTMPKRRTMPREHNVGRRIIRPRNPAGLRCQRKRTHARGVHSLPLAFLCPNVREK